MEDDRAQVDLGIAADIEDRGEEATSQRQPKKRFVGRRQAAETASRIGVNTPVESSGAVTSTPAPPGDLPFHMLTVRNSLDFKENPANSQPSPSRNLERSRHQRRNRSPTLKLLLRNTQNYPPHTNEWIEESGSADARRSAALRHNYLRHPYAILLRNRNPHHG